MSHYDSNLSETVDTPDTLDTLDTVSHYDSNLSETVKHLIHLKTDIMSEPNYAGEQMYPDSRRGRFIAPTADLSASMDIPLSGLFSLRDVQLFRRKRPHLHTNNEREERSDEAPEKHAHCVS